MRFGFGIGLLLIFAFSTVQGQVADSINSDREIVEFITVETKAVFPGGEAAMINYISQNLNYPSLAVENNISGKIILEFIINKDGSVSDVRSIGKTLGYGLEEEAIRVVQNMPDWKPATMKGEPVRMRFRLPINFSLPEVPDKKNKKTHPPPPPPEMRKELKRNPND